MFWLYRNHLRQRAALTVGRRMKEAATVTRWAMISPRMMPWTRASVWITPAAQSGCSNQRLPHRLSEPKRWRRIELWKTNMLFLVSFIELLDLWTLLSHGAFWECCRWALLRLHQVLQWQPMVQLQWPARQQGQPATIGLKGIFHTERKILGLIH